MEKTMIFSSTNYILVLEYSTLNNNVDYSIISSAYAQEQGITVEINKQRKVSNGETNFEYYGVGIYMIQSEYKNIVAATKILELMEEALDFAKRVEKYLYENNLIH